MKFTNIIQDQREEKCTSKMLQPLQPMIIYECNMFIGDELIILVLHKDDHIQNMKNEEIEGAHVNINI
jgi:hypothetical protein